MENLKKRSRKVRRELLGASILFFTISFVMSAYVFLDLQFGVSHRLAVKTNIELGVISDFVFLLVVPVFLSAVILQSFVLHRILKRFAEARQAGGRAFQDTFGDAMPIKVECGDAEDRRMMITVH